MSTASVTASSAPASGAAALFNAQTLRSLAVPLLIVLILAMMILPLPALILDLLFTFNIALAMMVLMAALYAKKPLDFSSFPAILLLTTLLRLSLNVASTRVVLMHGHTGPDAAGKVIEAFGHFLVGGNFAVGLVVFTILVVINFVVITKGAGRIAEVAARFTLDAMPGKQMAIDADLNAGLIGEAEARRRRSEVAQEAEFYGSMDGASKFVRGDAVAGILILFVNIIGGLAIGMIEHNLSLATATNNYVLLAIGDGLVAQIPALIISMAAGLVVSRVGTEHDVGTQVINQLTGVPQVLLFTGGVLGLLGIIPGMPHLAFLTLAAMIGGAGWWLRNRPPAEAAPAEIAPAAAVADASQEASLEDVTPIDELSLEVGYKLIPLVDKNQDGELLKRIKAIRKKFAQEIGYLPPTVHIRDNLELPPNGYRISLKGVEVGTGDLKIGMFLAINPGHATAQLPGVAGVDPAFGLPATWVDGAQRDYAQGSGYTVVDPATVAATHLSHILHTHAGMLLGRSELQQLLDHVAKVNARLVEDLTPKLIPLSTVQRVLQNLLDEGVHIRDLRTILETLTEHAVRTQGVEDLTAAVRVALGRVIVQQLYGKAPELTVLMLDPELEKLLAQAVNPQGEALGLEPGLLDMLAREVAVAADRQEALGNPAVLLTQDRLRSPLARLFKRSIPALKVLAHGEMPDHRTLRVVGVIGGKA